VVVGKEAAAAVAAIYVGVMVQAFRTHCGLLATHHVVGRSTATALAAAGDGTERSTAANADGPLLCYRARGPSSLRYPHLQIYDEHKIERKKESKLMWGGGGGTSLQRLSGGVGFRFGLQFSFK